MTTSAPLLIEPSFLSAKTATFLLNYRHRSRKSHTMSNGTGPAIKAGSTSSRSAHVLSIPEILEIILLELDDIRTLLHMQRVNRLFRALITTVKALQRALFFSLPEETNGYSGIIRTPDIFVDPFQQPLINPLLRDVFAPWFLQSADQAVQWMRERGAKMKKSPEEGEGELRFGNRSFAAVVEGEGNDAAKQRRRDAFLHPEASWRRMLVVASPICSDTVEIIRTVNWPSLGWAKTRGSVSEWEEEEDTDSGSNAGSESDTGNTTAVGNKEVIRARHPVTMGLLYDLTEDWVGRIPNTNKFSVFIYQPEASTTTSGEDQPISEASNNTPEWTIFIRLNDTHRLDTSKRPKSECSNEPRSEWKQRFRSQAFKRRSIMFRGGRPIQSAGMSWQHGD